MVGGSLLYALLRQPSAHGSDVFTLLKWLDEPDFVHPHHPLYLPTAKVARALVAPFGGDGMAAMAMLSAFTAGLALGGMHRAALALRGSPRFALWLAICAGATPSMLFFATLGELHAPFVAVVSLCWWATIRFAQSGRWPAGLLAGSLSGAATLFHATGQLLVPLLAVACLWLRARDRWSRTLPAMLPFCFAHAVVWAAVFHGMRPPGAGSTPDSASFLADYWRRASFAPFPITLVREWLAAFLPLSFVALAGFWQGRALPAALVQAAALVYVGLTTVLVQGVGDEVGAYALPVLFPAAVVALESVPRRRWWLLAALTVAGTSVHRACHLGPVPDHALGTAAAAFARDQPTVFFVGDEMQSQGIHWYSPRAELIEAWVMLQNLQQKRAAPITAAEATIYLQVKAAEVLGQGKRLVVTDQAIAFVTARVPPFAAAWSQLETTHRVERVQGQPGLSGWLVAAR